MGVKKKDVVCLFNVYFRERECIRVGALNLGRGRDREGGIDSKAGSGFSAVSTELNVGLEPTNQEITT